MNESWFFRTAAGVITGCRSRLDRSRPAETIPEAWHTDGCIDNTGPSAVVRNRLPRGCKRAAGVTPEGHARCRCDHVSENSVGLCEPDTGCCRRSSVARRRVRQTAPDLDGRQCSRLDSRFEFNSRQPQTGDFGHQHQHGQHGRAESHDPDCCHSTPGKAACNFAGPLLSPGGSVSRVNVHTWTTVSFRRGTESID